MYMSILMDWLHLPLDHFGNRSAILVFQRPPIPKVWLPSIEADDVSLGFLFRFLFFIERIPRSPDCTSSLLLFCFSKRRTALNSRRKKKNYIDPYHTYPVTVSLFLNYSIYQVIPPLQKKKIDVVSTEPSNSFFFFVHSQRVQWYIIQ